MKVNLPITDSEVCLQDGDNLLTTTDLKGAVTYANATFERISGYSQAELVGRNHNIIRHPHMPPEAFKQLWDCLKAGKSWMGLVKNRCKNGDYYWVSAYVTPVRENGRVVEYQSVRTRASDERVAAAERCYAALLQGKVPRALRRPALSLFARLALGSAAMLCAAGVILASSGASLPELALTLSGGYALLLTGLWHQLGPLRALTRRARAVADNPLGQLLYTGRRDELGQIAFAFDMQEAEASALVGRMSDAAQRLAQQSRDMVGAVKRSSQASSELQAETEQVAAAVEQMAVSVQEVARNAQQAAEDARGVERSASDGHRVASSTSERMAMLTASITESGDRLKALASQSEQISAVLEVINGIAEQTNLLALNAAIEAARAGEQGRGFAVVADEVRALAARTQQSTATIRQSIEGLQQGSQAAVSAMQESLQQVDLCAAGVSEATEALDGIDGLVSGISQASAQIAAAVEQQSSVSDEISRSLQRIRLGSVTNLEAMAENDEHAAELMTLVQRLEGLAGEFWQAHRARSDISPEVLKHGQRNHRRGLGAQHPRAETGSVEPRLLSLRDLASAETALRADQQGG
jgi:aerotaxis receptor